MTHNNKLTGNETTDSHDETEPTRRQVLKEPFNFSQIRARNVMQTAKRARNQRLTIRFKPMCTTSTGPTREKNS
jgi:hypothetical protein